MVRAALAPEFGHKADMTVLPAMEERVRRFAMVARAPALAEQKVNRDADLLATVRAMGSLLSDRLTDRLGNHRHVGDIRGRGLFWALEFVADRGSKAAFDPSLKIYDRVKTAAFNLGLAIYPMGGTIEGVAGDHVIVAPPYNVTAAEIDTIVARLGVAVDTALASIGPQK